jgi:VanZ family protein
VTRIAVAYLPAAAWAAFVFFIGGRPDLKAPGFLDFPGADKVAHFAMYGILGALLLVGRSMARLRHRIWWPLLVVALLGAADETRQRMVPGRTPDVTDWMADVAGAGSGILVLATLLKSRGRGGRDES